jgi:hypothetical protein
VIAAMFFLMSAPKINSEIMERIGMKENSAQWFIPNNFDG